MNSGRPGPEEELKALFSEAAGKVRAVWAEARARNEAAKQENETYRELMTLASAALDALERAIKKTWGDSGPK